MVIELDVGNSRIKWRVRSELELGATLTSTTVVDLFSEFSKLSEPAEILVASVRDDASLNEITNWAKTNWGITPKLAVVSEQASGLKNSYADISRMGVDRWLAMLAAYNQSQSACLVVDAGTALTIDAIDGAGQHKGGYILPGLGLGVSALEANTGIRLQQKETSSAKLELGKNTEAAVLNGILSQAIALIQNVASDSSLAAAQVDILLSGGDAKVLHQALAERGLTAKMCPALVLDGLALAETRELN